MPRYLELYIIFIYTSMGKSATPVTLSPSKVAVVCSGGQLELTCTTAGPVLEWDFRISENGTTTPHPGRLVNNRADRTLIPIMTDFIIFNISRVSLPESVPLVSKLVITATRSSINGTEVMCTCTDVVTNNASSTTVFIINSMLQDHPVVNFTRPFEQPERDSTQNVTLMWNESLNFALFSYHVDITPAALYTFDETRATVDILLGVIYNVNIVATHLSLCGWAMTIINIGLYYPDCGGQRSGVSLLEVIDYLNPEARNISFRHCPPTKSSTMQYLTTEFRNVQVNDIAILASVFSFILIISIAFTIIIGFLCGVCFIKKCKKPKDTGTPKRHHHHTAVSESENVLSTDTEQREMALELKQNAAYAPVGLYCMN